MRFIAHEGHASVSKGHMERGSPLGGIEAGFTLGRWVANCRTRGRYDPALAARLDAVPGWRWRSARR